MLGELNGSHTGCRYYPSVKGADKTARLGLFLDYSYKEDGIIITDVLEKGPFDNADTKVTEGTVLLAIDDMPLGKNIMILSS
ncbi:MAG: hypothetical protein HC831_01255 [Chloroflexia bacterium]|nr:hypothetical protein [Chloroflexia bacterium]